MSKQLAIDFEEMQMAFEDRDGDGHWFLDLDTGEVIRLTELDDDELGAQIETGLGQRYIGIPYQGSQAGYRDMADFLSSVDDHRLRALLDAALREKGAFRRFEDVLLEFPEERERWFAFAKERVHNRIRRWLGTEHVEPVLRTVPFN